MVVKRSGIGNGGIMKRIATHILMIVAAGILSIGCASNHLNEISLPREFHFKVAVNPCTKAVQEDDILMHPADVPFGVWSLEEGGSIYLDNEKVICAGEDNWVPLVNRIWDADVDEMNFLAYSPYGRACYDKECGICFQSYDIEEDYDLMYSHPLLHQKKDSSQEIIHISLDRALALVKLRVRVAVPDYVRIVVKNVCIDGIMGKGDFHSLPEPEWSNLSDGRSICFFEGHEELSGDIMLACEDLYMLPQVSDLRVNLLCDIISGEYVLRDQVLSQDFYVSWKPGRISSYIVKIDGNLDIAVDKDKE